MLTKTRMIMVQVTEQEKALAFYFYTQKPGFEKRSDQPMGSNQC